MSTLISRIEALRHSLRTVDAALITNINNVRYLTGFSGSSGFLLIPKRKSGHCLFITDFRYKEQAETEVSGCDIVIEKNRIKTIKMLIRNLRLKSLGFECSISYEFFSRLKAIGIRLKPMKQAVEKLRAIKDSSELRSIKEAVSRAESAFLKVMPHIRAGVAERAVAQRLEGELKKNGCKRLPFDIIVASGPNSAMPHARASMRRLEPGDLVIIDWGAEADGYFSDMTRTLLIKGGREDSRRKKIEIYQVVLEANKRAVSSISHGVQAGVIDKEARDIIKKAGYGEFFGHGVGHGVGIEVHERPHIREKAKEKVKDNMVFTIEPGIYVPHLGGVRIEDMVLVKNKRPHVLTSQDRQLKIIG